MDSNLKTSIFNPEDKLSERKETEILYVPFEQKEDAKKLGAKWDKENKYWYCDNNNESLIEKYKIRYVNISYDDKDDAKENGCKWDQDNKKWYTYNSNTVY